MCFPGYQLKEKVLEEVTSVSGAFDNSDDFLSAETRLIYQKLCAKPVVRCIPLSTTKLISKTMFEEKTRCLTKLNLLSFNFKT